MNVALVLASAPVALVNVYLALLTLIAALRRPDHGDARSGRRRRESFRVVVLVPAHNEERSVARTIDSVLGQGHPPELVAVHVVADNCSDATADVARCHGAHVHERSDSASPGKGPALGWLVERLARAGERADAMVILDADTSMEPGFLDAVHVALAGEGSVWQAYYTVREPEASPNTALRHAALALRHYVRPLGRTALGASCGLYGNGMVFRPEILHARQFTAHLTEDVEFQLELLLGGKLVGFLPDAVVEAEMPETLASARTQNERWELGRLQLARRYLPLLAGRAVLPRVGHRVALLDAALDTLVPPLSVLGAGTALVGAASLLPGGSRPMTKLRRGLAVLSVVALAFHVIAGLRVAGGKRSVYAALLHAPRVVAWKVALWIRVMVRPGRVSWARTARNEASKPDPPGDPNGGP